MGANQFDKPKSQASFFNWYIFTLYSTTVVSLTVIVYVEDNVGWKWGFGIGVITNLIGLAIFLCGIRFYHFDKPKGSPFVGLARVVVATTRKRNLQISSESKDYCYHGDHGMTDIAVATPSKSFRSVHTYILNIIVQVDCDNDFFFLTPFQYNKKRVTYR
jgi:peptide/histidine transporter 3/4